MSAPAIRWVDSAASTNSLLAAITADEPDAPHGLTIAAVAQTAGRGQRGNSWEASPGLNLTFSTLLRPAAIAAAEQFDLSTAVALAVADTVAGELPDALAAEVKVKWPNDIYVGDMKICGILIENSLAGASIARSIAGVGINVNQPRFTSDAPNPVSLAMLTQRTHQLEPMLRKVAAAIVERVDACADTGTRRDMRREYFSRLWRADGRYHRWRDNADSSEFSAAIHAVAPSGILTLRRDDGTTACYAFKEVTPL